jgi:Tol biopolymer transport system component
MALAPPAVRLDDGHAAWSREGRFIAFERTRRLDAGYSNTSIYVVRSNGRGLRHITSTSDPADAIRPVWSPNGAWIAFVVATKYLPPQVWWTRRDGRDVRTPLTGGETSNGELSPSWSSDGRRIAVVARAARGPGVYVARRDTGRARLVAAGDVHAVAWSPDGRRIAFSDSTSVALVSPRGGHVTRLAAPPGRIAWSPDGTRLAYATVCSVGIVAADATGTPSPGARCLAETERSLPSWSPDGGRIAYSNCRHLVCSVLVAPSRRAGTSGVYIARGRDPAWSQHGGTIAYTRLTRDSRPARIYLIRPDGTHDRPLLRGGR